MRFTPGQQLGHYKLTHLLGAGGMAEVWSATHQILGIRVAIKVMFRGDLSSQKRVLREGRAQAALDHPHILPIRDVIDIDGTPGLVLPLIDGPPLDALLERYRPTEEEALALFRAIVAGAHHAHQRGLIHRDLKPANVLLERKADRVTPRIADFGLVKNRAEEGMTVSGMVMGTLAYAAPEQLLDAASVDHRADIFSLGVMLVELLSGQRPFKGSSLGAILSAHQGNIDLSGVPARWRPLCRDTLKLAPEHRIANCGLMLDIIEELMPVLPESLLEGHRPLARAAQQLVQDRPRPATVSVATWGAAEPKSTLNTLSLFQDEPAPAVPKNNLPTEPNQFIGRGRDLLRLEEALTENRLVTVLGTGGMGKTRLSVHFAHAHLSDYPGGVYFFDLTEARTLDGIVFVVAQALDVSLGKGDPLKQLGHAIAGRDRCLLIFDNFEQIVDHVAETVGAWLERADAARCLVTSRTLLALDGEHEMRLDPLDDDEAAVLFVERARTRQERFTLNDDNRDAIYQLVAVLDKLPLAIELAAARINLMTPQSMLSRMNQRFKLLGNRTRARPGRQATLRAAIDWSWDLLENWEKAAFAQCAVFCDGFTLDAAEAVLDLDAFEDAPWLMDAVQSLVEKSLLRSVVPQKEGKMRFGMLVSIREYALEKRKKQPPEEVLASRHRHCAFYARRGEAEELEALHKADGVARWWMLSAEAENLLEANRFAVKTKQPTHAAQTALALHEIAQRKQPRLSLQGLTAALSMDGIDTEPTLRGALASALGSLHQSQGQMEAAEQHYARALRAYRGIDDRRGEGRVLGRLGNLYRQRGQMDMAEQSVNRAHDIFQDVRDRRSEANVQLMLGLLQRQRGRISQATPYYTRALSIYQEIGDRRSEALILGNMGNLCQAQGQMAAAEQHYMRSLDLHREVGNHGDAGRVLASLGSLFWSQGEMEVAEQYFKRAISIHQEVGNRRSEGLVLGNLGVLHKTQGRLEAAEQHYTRALSIHQETGNQRSEGFVLGSLGNLHSEQGRAEEAEAYYARSLGVLWGVGNRRDAGLVLGNLGNLHRSQGRIAEAEQHYTRALDIAQDVGDRRSEGRVLGNMGNLYLSQGQAELAEQHYTNALAIHREIGNRGLEGAVLGSLGRLRQSQGRPEVAEQHYTRALSIQREVGDRRNEGAVLGSLGDLCSDQGRVQEAEQHYTRALSAARDVRDRRTEGCVLGGQGWLFVRSDRLADGLALLREGEAALRESGDRAELCELLCSLARAEHLANNLEAADTALGEAHQIASALGVGPASMLAKRLAEAKAALRDR